MPDSATGTTSDTGTYVLTNVLGDTNDLITMYISNSFSYTHLDVYKRQT